MENIRFVKEMMTYVDGVKQVVVGNCIYMQIGKYNRIKAHCESHSVILEVINIHSGKVDGVELPFSAYFEPVRCSASAPLWTQHIDRGKWNFEGQYAHILPKDADYLRIGAAITAYINLFRDEEPRIEGEV